MSAAHTWGAARRVAATPAPPGEGRDAAGCRKPRSCPETRTAALRGCGPGEPGAARRQARLRPAGLCGAGAASPAVPCRAELCRAFLCHAEPSRAEPSPSMPCRAEPCHAMPCRAVLCRPVPYLSTAGQELQRPGARREPKRGMQLAAQGTVNKVLGASEKRQGPEQIQRRSSRGRGGRSHPGRSRSAPAGGGLASGGRAEPSPESGGAGLPCPTLPCPALRGPGKPSPRVPPGRADPRFKERGCESPCQVATAPRAGPVLSRTRGGRPGCK